jgi:hypothetical protein
LVCIKIEGRQPLGRAYVKPAGRGVRGNTLDVLGLLIFGCRPSRYTPNEFVSVVDVEDEHADAAVLSQL